MAPAQKYRPQGSGLPYLPTLVEDLVLLGFSNLLDSVNASLFPVPLKL